MNAQSFEVEAPKHPRGYIRVRYLIDGEEHGFQVHWKEAEKLRCQLVEEIEIAQRREG